MEVDAATSLRAMGDSASHAIGKGDVAEKPQPAAALHVEETPTHGLSAHIETIVIDEPGPEIPEAHNPEVKTGKPSRRIWWLILLAAAAALSFWGATYLWRSTHPSPFNVFWAPVMDAQEPALFCIADQNQYSFITLRDASEPTKRVVLKDNLSAVVIDDLDTIVRVASTLRANGKQYQLKGEESTNLSDLRNGPSIFIGAFDNAWTLRLTKSLRYHFSNNSDMTQFRVVDTNDPSHSNWVIDRTQQMATNSYQDFAIVARFTDNNTGKPTIIVAGVGRGGTIAAGEFLTNPDYLADLAVAMRSAGNKKNLEVVLSTQIIDGEPGNPKMEDTYFW
jgi:hypothetical protein